jgi:hypothetical protein
MRMLVVLFAVVVSVGGCLPISRSVSNEANAGNVSDAWLDKSVPDDGGGPCHKEAQRLIRSEYLAQGLTEQLQPDGTVKWFKPGIEKR